MGFWSGRGRGHCGEQWKTPCRMTAVFGPTTVDLGCPVQI
jgi:hypothetical protein